MLPRLSKSETFVKEIKTFNFKANRLNEPRKTEVKNLISNLTELVESIDIGHHPEYNGFITPYLMDEKRLEIVNLRKKITKFLDDA